MQPEVPAPKKKLPLVPLGILAAVAIVVAILVLKGLDYRVIVHRGLEVIRSTGPVTFLVATAFLPAFGAPLSVFTLTAGELFAPAMTMPGVIVAMMVAIAANLAFTYYLARYALRPVLSKVIRRYGYSIPSVTRENALSIALTIRLTPGPPFAVSSGNRARPRQARGWPVPTSSEPWGGAARSTGNTGSSVTARRCSGCSTTG